MPIRTGNSSARCATTAAPTADLGEANAAHTPSPVCLNNQPPCASIAPRNTSSWAASATRISSASASHRRVEPSTSVNRNVTTPEGAGTSAESHNKTVSLRSLNTRSTRAENQALVMLAEVQIVGPTVLRIDLFFQVRAQRLLRSREGLLGHGQHDR